jgi:hypothetical protein
MKSLGDAIHLSNRLIAFLEEADTECACELCPGLGGAEEGSGGEGGQHFGSPR